jgi:hypothetical protein
MALRPLGNTFLFAFMNETYGGRFVERRRDSNIILTNQDVREQGDYARWGKVLATGKKVTDFKVGDIVLIEAKMWTVGFTHQEVKIWKSDQTKVIAIGSEEVTYSN